MTLRAKLLALFLSLAVVPLLALGGIEYVRSLRALEALIADQNARIAQRAATTIQNNSTLLRSDLALLAENAEVQRWLSPRGGSGSDPALKSEAERFTRDTWSRIGPSYASVTYLDTQSRVLFRLGSEAETAEEGVSGGLDPVEQPIKDLESGATLGTVALRPALAGAFPLEVLAAGFGESGHGMVVDRQRGRILYHPNRALDGTDITSLMDAGTWEVERATLDRPAGRFRYHAGDTLRVASFVSLETPPWTVVVSAVMREFEAPFTGVRRWSLLLFLIVALLATLLFNQLLRRSTRSLEELTAATAVVGSGDFAPALPPAGRDEVGRLTASFDTMVGKIREMVTQIETSRQMAVLGQFAAQLSHEIRNPLTSIKLNLQKLERSTREGRLPETALRPLEISLREVARLDGVVRGVLDLARVGERATVELSLRDLVEEALEVVAGQAEAQTVRIERTFPPAALLVRADAAQLKGALLNLMLNALEIMPNGGTLSVRATAQDGRVRLAIADTGPGIPPAARAEIFRPFFTTKSSGTGLGLPLAKRAIEDHGGSLSLSPESDQGGTEFVIDLPVSEEPAA